MYIIDTTLRDGEQSPGLSFSIGQKKHIAQMLTETGIDEIEAGSPVIGDDERDFLKWCGKLRIPAICWCRADRSDLDAALETGLERVHISLPASDRLLKAFGKNRGWAEFRLAESITYCRKGFRFISIGFMDASRADKDWMKYLIRVSIRMGCSRIRIADTAGILDPLGTMELITDISAFIKSCRSARRIQLEFHPHNDLGMASANGITALRSGADVLSLTLLGIGERAGNARLEEVALALNMESECVKPYRMDMIRDICVYVSEVAGQPLPFGKPVVGPGVFSHESGIHVAAELADPLSFMPVDPCAYGLGSPIILTGPHSGTRGVQHILHNRSVDIDRATAAAILPVIRSTARKYGRVLDSDEVERIYHEYISNKNCMNRRKVTI